MFVKCIVLCCALYFHAPFLTDVRALEKGNVRIVIKCSVVVCILLCCVVLYFVGFVLHCVLLGRVVFSCSSALFYCVLITCVLLCCVTLCFTVLCYIVFYCVVLRCVLLPFCTRLLC